MRIKVEIMEVATGVTRTSVHRTDSHFVARNRAVRKHFGRSAEWYPLNSDDQIGKIARREHCRGLVLGVLPTRYTYACTELPAG